MRTASIAAVLVSSLFFASGVVAPLWGFTATSLPTRTTGFLVGAPGALALTGPEGADATMAVDGVTVLQIVWADCFGLYGSGNFRLDMLGVPVGENGGVAAGPDDPRLGLVSIPAVLEDGCWVAEGYYRVPDEFNRGSDAALTVRFATVEARFIPDVGGPLVFSIFLDLVRPPVVFVHGLWSEPETWEFSLWDDATFMVRKRADYRDSAGSSFAENRTVVHGAIQEALARCQMDEILCTQVDVVGHSMGGLLARIHSNSPLFATPLNRNLGNVRKIITLDTPHAGSPLASLLNEFAEESSSRGERMRAAFSKQRKPIDQGAIRDLATGSAAIQAIEPSPVPSHALVGVGGPEALSLLFPPLGRLYTALYLAAFVSGGDLFGVLGHDGVVGRVSQEGGLPSAATTLFGFPDGIHLGILFLSPGNTGSEAYSARIRELLDTPTSSPEWGLLPAPAAPLAEPPRQVQPAPAGEAPPKPARSGVAGPEFGLTITSPAPGTLVASGATITVVVEPDAGLTVDQVLVVGPNGADLDTEAPFEVAFTVPEEAFGSYSIAAFGKNATTEEYYASPDVSLTVQPVAALESIELGPAPAFLVGVGDESQLSVIGWFADGVPREVAASEVAFSVAPGGIVDVDSEGVVTALAIGQATVEALFETHSASLVVEVLPPGPLIFIDNFESGDLSWWSASVP